MEFGEQKTIEKIMFYSGYHNDRYFKHLDVGFSSFLSKRRVWYFEEDKNINWLKVKDVIDRELA